MAGTVDGGKLAAKMNKEKYGDDFYSKIGKIGGQNGTTGGFYARRDIARSAGRKGGLKSRRGPAKEDEQIVENIKQRFNIQ
jgi:general stress protein YciG